MGRLRKTVEHKRRGTCVRTRARGRTAEALTESIAAIHQATMTVARRPRMSDSGLPDTAGRSRLTNECPTAEGRSHASDRE